MPPLPALTLHCASGEADRVTLTQRADIPGVELLVVRQQQDLIPICLSAPDTANAAAWFAHAAAGQPPSGNGPGAEATLAAAGISPDATAAALLAAAERHPDATLVVAMLDTDGGLTLFRRCADPSDLADIARSLLEDCAETIGAGLDLANPDACDPDQLAVMGAAEESAEALRKALDTDAEAEADAP